VKLAVLLDTLKRYQKELRWDQDRQQMIAIATTALTCPLADDERPAARMIALGITEMPLEWGSDCPPNPPTVPVTPDMRKVLRVVLGGKPSGYKET